MRDALDDVTARAATLTAIGTGDVAYAQAFAEEQGVTFPLLVDDDSVSYRAVGTRKGSMRAMANPRLLAAGARATAEGHRQGARGRAPLVLGATHVVLPDGQVPFAWLNDRFDDDAPIPEVLAALPS